MGRQKQGLTEATGELGQKHHQVRLIFLKSPSVLSAMRCVTTPGGISAGCCCVPGSPSRAWFRCCGPWRGWCWCCSCVEAAVTPAVQQGLARRILNTLTGLGPCFIKLGQALSTRPDLVRRDWLEELTRLQDDLPAFPHATALACIREELGAPAEELFEEFPDTPIAAASLGQVYKARLQGQHWVAVKVQRPNLTFILRRDLVLIRALGVMTAPLLPLNLGFGLGGIIDEFGRSLFEGDRLRPRSGQRRAVFSALRGQRRGLYPEGGADAQLHPRADHHLDRWRQDARQRRAAFPATRSNGVDPHGRDLRPAATSGVRLLPCRPSPRHLFALPGRTGDLGHVGYVDFGMMDSISDSDRLTLTGAVVHLINRDFSGLAKDFQSLGFLSPTSDLAPIIPALEEVLGGSLGDSVRSFNFKAITDRFSELMFDYPFRVPARFALIIRAVVSQEGLALRLDPNFRIIAVAYPYVARRLLAGDTSEMREKLLEVIFDESGRLRLDRLESLLDVVGQDAPAPGKELIPVAGAGLRLLLSRDGADLRKRLLMTLIRDDRLHTDDVRALVGLLGRTFGPGRLAGGLLQRLNPLAAA